MSGVGGELQLLHNDYQYSQVPAVSVCLPVNCKADVNEFPMPLRISNVALFFGVVFVCVGSVARNIGVRPWLSSAMAASG